MIDTRSSLSRLSLKLNKLASGSQSTESVARDSVDDRLDGLFAMSERPLPSRGYIVRQ